jgi:chemotaxis protein MotB
MENEKNEEVVKSLQKLLEDSINQNNEMKAQIAKYREINEKQQALIETELKLLKETQESLNNKLKNEIGHGVIKIEQDKDRIRMSIAEELFFESGKADIKPEGKTVLLKIADVLKKIPEKNIRVEGHTDNVPIGPKIRGQYPTNWELGAIRAVNVVKFLQEDGGIDPLRLTAVSYGQYRPKATNRTKAGRSTNRRIEIILIDRDLDLAEKMRENLAVQ